MQQGWAVYFEDPVPYEQGVRIQERLVAARMADKIRDTVLFLEHEPVVTLGARGRDEHLLVDRRELARRGIALAQASRGGDVTYHGPGQLVMYPIMRLGGVEADSHGYLRNLEEIVIRVASSWGIRAFRRAGMTGAWTREGKIAAIGIRLRRWVTFHGLSLNVAPDPTGFETIVPCGLEGERVTSLRALLGEACPSVPAVRERMREQFADVCGRELTVRSLGALLAQTRAEE